MSSTQQLKVTVEGLHGGSATFVRSVPVFAVRGKTQWNGAVQVFDLAASPSGAERVYAWSCGLADGQRQSFAILHAGDVTSAREAVRAAIFPEEKKS